MPRRGKLSWIAAYALAPVPGLLIAPAFVLFGGNGLLRSGHPWQGMIFWAAGAALGGRGTRAPEPEMTTLNLSGRELH
jgi:hypothetical protein